MSQEALAYAADVHPSEVSRLERAKRDTRLSTIVRVATALELAPASLLDGIGSQPGASRGSSDP
jgi:predicted transcriptional regulator